MEDYDLIRAMEAKVEELTTRINGERSFEKNIHNSGQLRRYIHRRSLLNAAIDGWHVWVKEKDLD